MQTAAYKDATRRDGDFFLGGGGEGAEFFEIIVLLWLPTWRALLYRGHLRYAHRCSSSKNPPPGLLKLIYLKAGKRANNRATPLPHIFSSIYMAESSICIPEAKFLDEIQTKGIRVFLLAVHSHLYSFALRFYFFTLTQPPTVSTVQLLHTVNEKEENLIENHTPFHMV